MMSDEDLQKILKDMVNKAIEGLKKEVSKTDHTIEKLIVISRYEGYGIALKELGADTNKLGSLIETEARQIEPFLKPFFK